MQKIVIFIITAFALVSCSKKAPEASPQDAKAQNFEVLREYLTGSFNSAKQAAGDSAYVDISLEMARIWENKDAGVWVYVEQALSSTTQKPYRQRVYQLQMIDDSVFSSTVYSIPKASRFVGAYINAVSMEVLTPDSLTLLSGCDLLLHFNGKTFTGKTGDTSCTDSWGEATYVTSKVTVSTTQMQRWDQGWNKAGEQVWGAEKGPYIFDKIK